MEVVQAVPLTVGAGILASFAGATMVEKVKRRDGARSHLYREVIPDARRALDTPEGVVAVHAMSSAIKEMKAAGLSLGRKERASIARIEERERSRWALVGFGPGMGEKAMPEFHLKNEIRSELAHLHRLVEHRLRWRPWKGKRF